MNAAALATPREWSTQFWVPLFLILALFFIPISVSLKSVFLTLATILILLVPAYRKDLRISFSTYWGVAAVILFVAALIGMAWSPAKLKDQLYVLEKYSKFLYLPILAAGFTKERIRFYGLHAFLLSMLITCICSIYAYFFKDAMMDAGNVFLNHIVTGYFIAFAAFISGLFFWQTATAYRWIYAFLWLLFSFQNIFINTGRTGLVIYVLLMGLLVLQVFSFKKALLAFGLVLLVIIVAIYTNTGLQNRIHAFTHDWQQYHENNKNTAIGYRLQFHSFAKKLFLYSPWIGNGTGSFTYYYKVEKPIPKWNKKLREPHSQYWLVSSELGIIGLFLLLSFFLIIYISSWDLNKYRPIVFAMLVATLIGSLTDSLLFYSAPGYFFIVMVALCFGELVEHKTT